jgi:hypothetical protein
MSVTVPELGAILLLLFALGYWLGVASTLTALAGFFGAVLLGDSGWIGRALTDIAMWVARMVGDATGDVLGVSFVAILTIGLGFVYLHDLHPRKSAGKRTAWIGVALGALVVAGATGIPALSGVHSAIVSAAGNVISIL